MTGQLTRRIAVAGLLLVSAIVGVAIWQFTKSKPSIVGHAGTVTLQIQQPCANPDAVSFDGYVWEATQLAPEQWLKGPERGRFVIRTTRTASFEAYSDHRTVSFARLRKGAFSSLPCAIR